MTDADNPGEPVRPDPLILVVDDVTSVRQAIGWALEDEGLRVDQAADGAQALACADAHRPDLAVLDIMLPIMDGYQVAEALRSRFGPAFPILAITADSNAPAKALRAGAYAYVRKPFEVTELLAAVRAGLQHPNPT